MAKDLTKVIRSLQTTAVARCRERLDEAAARAKDLISRSEDDNGKTPANGKPEYGVTSVLKRRHGL
ncbi:MULTISPECIES: hypothetical protein [unclassified Methanoregula]|uniref:hypothetical protein n=1 Tax=unclassified Methanoregula TaxID=2649730 RepID=UPI0025F29110|nr:MULTISPECIES: hypothetical protein [unclassified Methanoregula]